MTSKLTELLSATSPSGIAVPHDLDRAWSWMEGRGWGLDNGNGYFLTPYAGERQLGIVFASGLELTGWFEPGQPGYDRLLPIAEIDGSGGLAVLWAADDGSVQLGGLSSEGEANLLAENALDFVRLVAIGYRELADWIVSQPPDTSDEDEAEAVEAHADFREWVTSELGVEVPEHWQAFEPDPFRAWVNETLGR